MTAIKKTGPISEAEGQIIKANLALLPLEKIAVMINRSPEAVENYAKKKNLITSEMDDKQAIYTNLRATLHSKEYWGEILKQFTDDELKYFESSWIALMLQFREDVLYAEELEIKQFITIEILINRNLAERKKALEEIEKIQEILDREYMIDESIRDMQRVANLESQLTFVRSSVPAFGAEYTKLLEKKGAISKDLKATRDQRVKRIEDSKSSFVGFIRALEDADLRERLGEEAELNKMAKNQAYKRLSQYHTYVDGKIDRPILNSETVEMEEEINE